MEETMTPSQKQITQRQIDKAVANYRTLLEKHAPKFESAAVQTVLGQSEFADAQFALFRERIEAISGMIVRHVKVDRTRTPQKVVDANGRTQYVDKDVLATMPNGEGDEVDVYFFKVGRDLSVGEVEKEYALRGLVPDPRAQAAVNEADPSFADEHPNGSQWGNNCYLTFYRWRGERNVYCSRHDCDWDVSWFLSGVRK